MCGPSEEPFDWHKKKICQHCGKTIELLNGKYSEKKTNNLWLAPDERKFVCALHSYEDVWGKESNGINSLL